MIRDGETAPSPLPSPVFARCSPTRGTVARRCREFYLRRLERTSSMQKRWSLVDSSTMGEEKTQETASFLDTGTGARGSSSAAENSTDAVIEEFERFHPLRKCQSSLDIAMGSLRKEISSLISQDNDLFRQLLSLHDSIAELRERQRSCYALCPDDDEEDDEEETDLNCDRDDSPSPSLESLSDIGDQETSPDSTLSSRSSLSASGSSGTTTTNHHHRCRHNQRLHNNHRHHNRNSRHHLQQRSSSSETHKKHCRSSDVTYDEDSRPLVFIDRSEICFRCRKVAPPYRRSSSITSLYWLQEDMDSYDSGIHLQGCHSDSDHEIFV